jgi:chromobox protein 5
VESIRAKKIIKNKINYLVKWESYPEEDNTWEPATNLSGCPFVIEEFELKQASQKKKNKQYQLEVETILNKRIK